MTFSSFRTLRTCSPLVIAMVLANPSSSSAQTWEPEDEWLSETQSVTQLERLVISARKRSELEFDVPISTTVLAQDRLTLTSLDAGADIARQSPNANFIDMARPGDRYSTMRGIGPLGTPLNSLDSTVGFAVDGVASSSFGYGTPLFDVESVEVLRGPQGTLFGRNALGGLVNVVTKKADGEREFRVDTQIGSDGYLQGTAVAADWLAEDVVAGRAALQFQKFDGDIPNGIIGGTEGGVDLLAGRGSLRLTPDSTLEINITGTMTKDDRTNTVWLLEEMPNFPISGSDVVPVNNRRTAQGVVEATKDFGFFSATSITSYQNIDLYSFDEFTDSYIFGAWLGMDPSLFVNATDDIGSVTDREGIFNQEFRINSAEDSDWDWVLGASYFRSDFNTYRVMKSSMWPTSNGTTDNNIVSQTFALFGDATVPLNDRFDLSGGVRIAHDHQKLDGNFVSNGAVGLVPSLQQQNEFSDTYITGRAALSYAWNDEIKSYISVARGYSSGGFERTTQNAAYGTLADPFLPSTAWTYEFGTKADIGDRIQLGASLFYNNVSDGQLSGFDMTTYQVFFANQDYRSYGFELQGSAEIASGFTLHGGIGYTQSEVIGNSTPAVPVSVDGNHVPHAPNWTANLGVEYRLDGADVGFDGELVATASYQYVGARFTDVQNAIELAPYGMINAKLAWENDNLGLNVFVNNLLDERPISYASAYSPSVTSVIAGRGRVFGVGASYKW